MALCGIIALLLVGCGAAATGDEPATDGDVAAEQPAQVDDVEVGLAAEEIVSAAEAEGLACEEKEPRLKSRAQVIACKGDDYVILTATRLVSADLMDKQIAAAKKATCKSDFGLDGVRFAVSDAWVLSPGGDDDRNIETFTAVTKTLGLEWTEDLC